MIVSNRSEILSVLSLFTGPLFSLYTSSRALMGIKSRDIIYRWLACLSILEKTESNVCVQAILYGVNVAIETRWSPLGT